MARGDHIFVQSLGYSHHGIDCGDGTVVHFNASPLVSLARQLTNRPPQIEFCSLEQFTAGRSVFIRLYDVCDSPDKTIERALSRLGETDYRVFENNCEHFAVWCKTGFAHSTQVEALSKAGRNLRRNLPASFLMLKWAKRIPDSRVRLLVYGGAIAVTAGTFAVDYAQRRWSQRTRGES